MGRSDKAIGHNADMYVAEQSDGLIVPTKRANKALLLLAAESVEGRRSVEGGTKTGQVLLLRAGSVRRRVCLDGKRLRLRVSERRRLQV
jgi:hypothetical protein